MAMRTASGNDRAHAVYAPSAAHRWMRCPASIKATANVPNLSSVYAAEGTVAHHVLEQALIANKAAWHWIGETIVAEVNGEPKNFTVTKEMADAVQIALDYLRPIIDEAMSWSPERKVSLATIGAPGCYGTSDFTAIVAVAGRLIVVDYKHGAGETVEVENNPQLMIYGLGALLELPRKSLAAVQTTIVQPRKPHPLGPIRSHTYTTAELVDFAADVLDAIEACEADDPPFVPGDHCHWCPIEHSCRARASAVACALPSDDMAEPKHREYTLRDMRVMTPDEQEALLVQLESLDVEGFIKSLRAAVHAHGEAGGALKAHKIVAKRGSRVWTEDEDTVEAKLEVFAAVHGKPVSFRKPAPLVTPAEAEKLIGKGAAARALLKSVSASISSGTNLVPLYDSRPPAAISAEDEFDALTPD